MLGESLCIPSSAVVNNITMEIRNKKIITVINEYYNNGYTKTELCDSVLRQSSGNRF